MMNERTEIVMISDQSENMVEEAGDADWSRTQLSFMGVQEPSSEHWDSRTRSKSKTIRGAK